MEKKIQSYETMIVADMTKGDDAVKAVIEKFTNLIKDNGEITKVDEWGKRRLAYPINDRTEGFYTLIYFKAPTDFVAELQRLYNINDGILRSIVVCEDEKITKAAPAKVPEVVAEEVAPVEAPAEVAEPVAEEATEAPAAE